MQSANPRRAGRRVHESCHDSNDAAAAQHYSTCIDRSRLWSVVSPPTSTAASRKDKDYNAIISAKNLDRHYQSVTFGTFGSFGTGTWSVITKACDPASHPKAVDDDNPWNAPGPKRDFMLSLGFALQRANSRMLRNADRRRRSARMSGKYSSGTHPLSSDDDY